MAVWWRPSEQGSPECHHVVESPAVWAAQLAAFKVRQLISEQGQGGSGCPGSGAVFPFYLPSN